MGRLSRRPVTIGRWMMAVAVLFLVQAVAPIAEAQTPRKFSFILDFLPYGEFSAFFLALDKGWYREEGLDVEILRGSGGLDTVKRIAARQGDAGIADFSAIVSSVANEDAKIKAIAAVSRQNPFSIFVREGTGINSIKDLVGKTISVTTGNTHRVLWPMVAQHAGIPVDSVKWVAMDGASMGPALITGRVDAAPFALWHKKRLDMQAAAQGVTLKRFPYSEYGVDAYSLTILASDDAIQKNSDALKRFLRGSIRGIKYTWQDGHAREGAEAVVKANPVVDIEAAAGASEVTASLAIDEDITSGRFAIGQLDPQRVERVRDMYVRFLSLKRTPAVEEIFTNALLPQVK